MSLLRSSKPRRHLTMPGKPRARDRRPASQSTCSGCGRLLLQIVLLRVVIWKIAKQKTMPHNQEVRQPLR